MHILDHHAVAVEEDIEDADAGQDQGKYHKDDSSDHARKHCIAWSILEALANVEDDDGNRNEPNEAAKTELVVISHIEIEIMEQHSVSFGVKTRVQEVVGKLAEAAWQCDKGEEEVTADPHHDMEHVLVSLAHKHGHVVLFHLLGNNDCDKQK